MDKGLLPHAPLQHLLGNVACATGKFSSLTLLTIHILN